jgi:hypothetical protein
MGLAYQFKNKMAKYIRKTTKKIVCTLGITDVDMNNNKLLK